MTKMSYDEAVSFIHGRRKFTKDPSLVKMRRMAELMGNPQKKLKLIHVTGTNGKGSVTAYLRELLMSHGYRVGTFTSPFIVRFNERVAINGEMSNASSLSSKGLMTSLTMTVQKNLKF